MKSISLLLALVLIVMGLASRSVSAHVLKYDGDIAAVLHINPDDDPVSGKLTSYSLFFSDESNRFTLPTCDCTVSVQENGQTIATQKLVTTSALVSNDTFTFPSPNVYTLVISGKPIKPNAFQSFTLRFLVRVESGTLSEQPFPILLWVGLGSLMGLILLGGYAGEFSYNNDKKS